jgi:hypothetical protein
MRAFTRFAAACQLATALASAASAAPAPCDTCEDLCRLVDEYLQTEKRLELYQQYAGPSPQKVPGAGESARDAVSREFEEWAAQRELPCVVPPGAQPANALGSSVGSGSGGSQTELETQAGDASCKITFGQDELGVGNTQQRYEEWVNCKPLSDAAIEREKVNQSRCLQEYASNPSNAASVLAEPSVSAESEVLAHLRHKELLEAAIRDLIQKQGCGWEPTERQRADPTSVPTLKQMQQMNLRATNAARLLNAPSVEQ